jgi:PAS domain S-box-containing protein
MVMVQRGADRGARSYTDALVDESSDALVAVSPDGKVMFWSAGARRIFGYPAEVAVGRSLHDLTVPPDRTGEARAALAETCRTGSCALVTVRQREDGSQIHVEIAMRAVRDAHGELQFIAVTQTDVSSLIRLRVARAAESRFRGLLEGAPDAMVIVDDAGRIQLVNGQTEQLFGYTRDELLDQPVELLVPERFREPHPEHRRGYLVAPRPRPMGAGFDLFGRRKDGSEFPAEISLSPIDTEDGRLVTAAIRDITERRKAADALRLANRELEAFSYSVAHDLRAPLRGMNGFAQLVLDHCYDKLDHDAQDWLVEIVSNARRMGALIDALLALSRVARLELKRERIDLTALARASAAHLAASDVHRSVEITIAHGLYADADPYLARIVVDNLLSNAWKFTSQRAHPRVEVGVGTAHDAFFVRDNGCGFDVAFASKLFQPFHRLHTVSEFPGTGIGLASVQRILQRHGGAIWAEAQVGEGATFYFTFHGRSRGAEP